MADKSIRVRAALAGDVPLIHTLIRELASYEREPESVRVTEADLLRDGFGAEPAFRCLIGECDGLGCGFALYFPYYSTWAGSSLYLEDLFVLPEYRGLGLGKALLARVATLAVELGCSRLDWSVLRWNEPAIRFYESLGAESAGEWDRMRLSAKALAEVASQRPADPVAGAHS